MSVLNERFVYDFSLVHAAHREVMTAARLFVQNLTAAERATLIRVVADINGLEWTNRFSDEGLDDTFTIVPNADTWATLTIHEEMSGEVFSAPWAQILPWLGEKGLTLSAGDARV